MQSTARKYLLRMLTIIFPVIVLIGCGGDGPAPIAGTARAVLVNSPIEGAEYATATQSGFTNALGEFRYLPGESVTFSVGGIVLGTVAVGANGIVTPVELTGNTLNGPGLALAPNAATNQLVFLQSIDEDQTTGGYATGITISPATTAAAVANNVTLDFNSPTFAADVVTVVNTIAPPANTVVTNTAALDNFYETYKSLGGANTFSWPFPGYPPFPAGNVDLLTNGTFEIPDAFLGAVAGAPGWTTFENVFTKANVDVFNNFGPVSHDVPGKQFLTMFGPFSNQTGANASGAFQSVDAVPGATYDASVWVMNWQPDALQNLGIFQLTFWDGPNATGNALDTIEVLVDSDPATGNLTLIPQDGADVTDWTQLTISATAPPGTVSAKVFLLHIQIGGPACPGADCLGGSIFWDDASLIGPDPGSSSSFNTLVFSDEFNPGTTLDPNVWTLETGTGTNGWGNNEWQVYTASPANISIDTDPNNAANGHLRISALLNTANCPVPAVGMCGFQDGNITSARINTFPNPPSQGFVFKYGRIEASIKLPTGGYGTWPAFWMLGENFPIVGWPSTGEIDVVEMFGKGGVTNQEAIFTLHWCDESLNVGCAFPNGYATNSGKANLGQPLGNAFRVYAAEWDANGVTWTVDGLTYHFTAIQPATMEEFLENFFVILNVAIGGNPFGGFGTPESAPDDQGWPREMLVDWVRVYQ